MLGFDWYLVAKCCLRMAILSDQRQGSSNGPNATLLCALLPQSSDVLVVGAIPEVLPQGGPKTSELKTPRLLLINFYIGKSILYPPPILLI